MARYIDADALLRDIYRNPEGDSGERCAQILEAILSAPTVDVAPRAEVAREIFEEIEKNIVVLELSECLNIKNIDVDTRLYAELKNKYTEENEA